MQSREVQKNSVLTYLHGYEEGVIERLLPSIIDRISFYGELTSVESSELSFFKERPLFTDETIERVTWKDSGISEAGMHLTKVASILETTDFSSPESLKASIMPYADEVGRGNVLWPLRMTLSGQEKSIDPFTILYVLQKEESLARISSTCTLLLR